MNKTETVREFTKVPITDLTLQYKQIKDEVEEAVKEVLSSGAYILGKNVNSFESELAKYLQCKHVITCANGTDALQLSLLALGIKPGDEIITVAHTFFATTEAILLVGAKPVFVDIKESDYNIDTSLIEKKITSKTKAIIPVHLYGQPCDIDKVIEIANKHKLFVIEDTAQALGAKYKGKFAGTFGNIGTLSFFPTKNFGACGDGGAVCTNDDNLADLIKQLRVHGSPIRYVHDYVGLNSRLDEIQAAVLRIKLKYLDKWNQMRIDAAKRYDELLSKINITPPKVKESTSHIYHQYTIRIKNRDDIQKKLLEKGIEALIYYPIPVHKQKAVSSVNDLASLPVTEKICEEIISLPMYPEISPEIQNYVIQNLKIVIDNS